MKTNYSKRKLLKIKRQFLLNIFEYRAQRRKDAILIHFDPRAKTQSRN